jgi:hypothetical protein
VSEQGARVRGIISCWPRVELRAAGPRAPGQPRAAAAVFACCWQRTASVGMRMVYSDVSRMLSCISCISCIPSGKTDSCSLLAPTRLSRHHSPSHLLQPTGFSGFSRSFFLIGLMFQLAFTRRRRGCLVAAGTHALCPPPWLTLPLPPLRSSPALDPYLTDVDAKQGCWLLGALALPCFPAAVLPRARRPHALLSGELFVSQF